jgi:hypothetical protein
MDDEIELIQSAYEELLKLPHGRTRLRVQAALVTLRDELAYLTQRDPEDVQNEFEAAARR